ncbi:unnamed protein product [Urochloa decumbens]|uniref:HMA domain-containing protein n=1 Tax=Urochloa decumbens TaxID=240449 RepID=A0ABC8XG15_9POAL
MRRIKDMITPFSSRAVPACRKWTTDAILGTLRKKDHALAAAPIVIAGSDDDDDVIIGAASSEPDIVLKMYLHCASCAAKVERIVMDIPGVEKVATDVAESRVTVTGTAGAAVVATSVQVRTRRPVTVVRDGRSVTTARTQHGDQVRVRGTAMAAQVRPVPERTAAPQASPQAEEEIAGRRPQPQDKATEWTAEVRIARLDCGRCISRIAIPWYLRVREIKLAHASGPCNDDVLARQRHVRQRVPNMNQHLRPGQA